VLALLIDEIFRLSKCERSIFEHSVADKFTNFGHLEAILFEVNYGVQELRELLWNFEKLSQSLAFVASRNLRSILLALPWMSLGKVTTKLLCLLELMVADWALVRFYDSMIVLHVRIDLFDINFFSHLWFLDGFTLGPDCEQCVCLRLAFVFIGRAVKIILRSFFWNICLRNRLLVLLLYSLVILFFKIQVMKIVDEVIVDEVAIRIWLWEGFLSYEVWLVSFGKHFLCQIVNLGVRWRLWHCHECCHRRAEQKILLRHV